MAQLILPIGISGSGKSKYLSETYGEVRLFSLEVFQKQEAGDLVQTFEKFIGCFSQDVVGIDAENLQREQRISLYNAYKKAGKGKVTAVVCFASIATASQRQFEKEENQRQSKEFLQEQFRQLQVPRIGVDCDEIILTGEKWFFGNSLEKVLLMTRVEEIATLVKNDEIQRFILKNITPHETPYHLESVDEHIRMVIENASGYLKLTAIFHDLGKGFVKEKGHYPGHEFVSSHYLLNFLYSNDCHGTALQMDDVERIYEHMNGHHGFSAKMIKRNRLEQLLPSIKEFAKVDEVSRIL